MKPDLNSLRTFLLPVIIGAAGSIFLFIETMQMRAPGLRKLAAVWLFFLVFVLICGWLQKRLKPLFIESDPARKKGLIIFSFIFAAALLIMTPVKTDKFFYLLLPSHNLTITIEPGAADRIEILQFNTAAGAIDPTRMLKFSQGQVDWQGKVGNKASLAFKPIDLPTRVTVTWDDHSQLVDLSKPSKQGVIFVNQGFAIPWFHTLLWLLSVWVSLAALVFFSALLLVSMHLKPASGHRHWIWFAFPMLVVWGIYILTFWPGFISPDSVTQWGEVQSMQFSDAHPAFHSLFLWLLSRLWNTPAILVLFHIFLLSFLTAWGLGELQNRKVSPRVLWAIALLFAFFPINGLLIISVWKDITYACALYALFIQFVKISLSNGAWLKNNWNLAGLVVTGLAAAFARHNGLPVVLASLLVLPFIFREYWRRISVAVLLLFLLWAGIHGPLYSALNVKRYPGFTNILYLDHIDAHIQAGTPLRSDEKAFLETLLPLSAWPYDCADSDIRKTDGPIPFDYFTQTPPEPARIAINLFLRAPVIDIQHTLCSSSLVWKINTGHYISVVSLAQDQDGAYSWVTDNEYGLVEQSQIPALLPLLANSYSEKDLIAKPALYLLLTIFLFVIIALRGGSKRLVIAIPLVFQTGVMLLVTYAQDFRYLYSTVLIALFSLALVFVPDSVESRDQTKN